MEETDRAVLAWVITLPGINLVVGDEELGIQEEDFLEEVIEVILVVARICPEEGLLMGSNTAPSTSNKTSNCIVIFATGLGTLPMNVGKPSIRTRVGEVTEDSVLRAVEVKDLNSV